MIVLTPELIEELAKTTNGFYSWDYVSQLARRVIELEAEKEQVCEWEYTKEKDTEYSTLETYKNPHLNIVAELNYFQPKEFKYCFVCGKRIKYVESEE